MADVKISELPAKGAALATGDQLEINDAGTSRSITGQNVIDGMPDVVAGGADGFMIGADKTKLDGIESSATADQTNAEIKTAYEANANTNEYDDAEQTKLAGIATGAIANVVEDTSPQLGSVLDTNAFAIDESEGTAVASSATTNIWVTGGNTVHITGTTTITSFGTAPRVGAKRMVIFDAALTLTDGANLNLPGAANITTAADDFAVVYAETTTLFKVQYFKESGDIAPVQPAFSAHKNGTNQTGVVPDTDTLVTWSTEVFDTNNNFASNRFTPTVAGKYLLVSSIQFTQADDFDPLTIQMRRNGTAIAEGRLRASGGSIQGPGVAIIDDANGSTTFYEVFVRHSATSDKIIDGILHRAWFSGMRIGA